MQHRPLLAGTRTDGLPLILRLLGAIRESTVLLGTGPKSKRSQWMSLCCFKWALNQAVAGRDLRSQPGDAVKFDVQHRANPDVPVTLGSLQCR